MSALFQPLSVPLRGRHVIEASAGTGKTYSIATLYIRLVLESGWTPEQLLVVTYTKAATAELRERLRRRLHESLRALIDGSSTGDESLDAYLQGRDRDSARKSLVAALQSFDRAAIFTIHSFCQRALRDFAFECGGDFDSELVSDETSLRRSIIADYRTRLALLTDPRRARIALDLATASELSELASATAGDPSTPLLPSLDRNLEDCLAGWDAAFEDARDEWARESETVAALLGDASLNKTSYNPKTVETWPALLDDFFAAPLAPLPDDSLAQKLRPGTLRDKTKKNGHTPESPFFDAWERLCGEAQALGPAVRIEFAAFHHLERERRRAESGLLGFNDLLIRLRSALRGDRRGSDGSSLGDALRERFPVALIDEFQDTDPVQFEIFDRIHPVGANSGLFLIGDPKQSIFGFRGADVFAYARARDAGDATLHGLTTNWRADDPLVEAVNDLFSRSECPFATDAIDFPRAKPHGSGAPALQGLPDSNPIELLWMPKEGTNDPRVSTVAGRTAGEIARLLRSEATLHGKALAASDIAVLCRTNGQAVAMQEALRRHDLPSVLHGDRSVFDSPEAADMQRMLNALAEPRNAWALREALATPLLGIPGETIATLFSEESEWEQWDTWVERFEGGHRSWLDAGFFAGWRRVFDDCDVTEQTLARVGGERSVTNWLHLAELLHRAAAENRLGPLELCRWLETMRVDAKARDQMAADSAQVRLETDASAVTLTTVHKSKGLEYPVVYCPFLWGAATLKHSPKNVTRFHDPKDDRRFKVDVGSDALDEHRDDAKRETLSEALRLTYVALTRAQHRVSLVWGPPKGAKDSALAWLFFGDDAKREVGKDPEEQAARLRDLLPDPILFRPCLEEEPSPALDDSAGDAPALAAPTFPGSLPHSWRSSSFSALVADRSAISEPVADGRDRDELGAELDAPRIELESEASAPLAKVPLADFPAGAGPGNLLHAILENAPPSSAKELRDEIDKQLARHAFEADLGPELLGALTGALRTPIDDSGFRLCDVAPERRAPEMEFLLPVRPEAGGLRAPALADALRRHGAPGDHDAIAALPFAPLAGYLRGFIDLVFEHEGRWYLVDYKSNHLGPTATDYDRAAMLGAMTAHHYVLQYHLYALALHRHLRMRLPGYRHDEHFGGVRYLFLRGMAPNHPKGCGVFSDLPSLALLDDLARAIDPEFLT